MGIRHDVKNRGNIESIYNELYKFINNGRNKRSRMWANNTTVSLNHKMIIVTYHGTDVIRISNNKMTLNSGGWRTKTTKERIDWFLPLGIYIYQEKGIWYLTDGMWNNPNRVSLVFTDWMVIPNCFTDPKQRAASDKENRRIAETTKKINKYCRKLGDMIMQKQLEVPSGGDCWFCLFVDKDKKAWGDKNPEHLISHLEQMYIVPSLVLNALNDNGMNGDVTWKMFYNPNSNINNRKTFKDFATRSVRRYFKKRLGIGA